MSAAFLRTWQWLEERPTRGLVLAFAIVIALRVPFAFTSLQPDEGGFLYVARQWDSGGSSLYGDLWVDRPPFLLLVFKLAAFLGGGPWVRVVGMLCGFVAVTAAWWAGRFISNDRGAVAAALLTAVLASNYTIDGYALTGDGIAGALVLSSCALTLFARYRAPSFTQGILAAFGAGILGAVAILTKQSYMDALIFAAVLLVVRLRSTWPLVTAGLAGLAVPVLITAGWAASDSGPGVLRLWGAMYRFRQRAIEIVELTTSEAQVKRITILVILFFTSGLVLLVLQSLYAAARYRRTWPDLGVAMTAMLAYAVFAVIAGASYWNHYLLQLVPICALGTAVAAARPKTSTARHTVWFAGVCSVAAAVYGAILFTTDKDPLYRDIVVATWLRDAAEPGDSVVLAYGNPNVIERSGMTTPYRYMWSLPIRGRDPELKLLVRTLNGPSAPTWLVEIGDFDWWGLDNERFEDVRERRYRVVASVCGRDIFLLRGEVRTSPLPPIPDC